MGVVERKTVFCVCALVAERVRLLKWSSECAVLAISLFFCERVL